MKSFHLEYVGDATVDKRLSGPMIPWVVAQIRRGTKNKSVWLEVGDNCLRCRDEQSSREIHRHPLLHVSRLTLVTPVSMFYSVRSENEPQLLTCHLYQSTDPDMMMELVGQMKEQSSRLQANGVQGNGCGIQTVSASVHPDISPSSSQFFEVLYIGKIRVSHKKVPDTFIDDALDKFSLLEKTRKQKQFAQSTESEDESTVQRSGSSDTLSDDSSTQPQPPKIFSRKRSGSVGSILLTKKPDNLDGGVCSSRPSALCQEDVNRTMVFHVGRSDLRLISPDRKQLLLHKYIRDIVTCLQGVRHGSYFAFVCRESGLEQPHYIGYVFNCESTSVACDIVAAIKTGVQGNGNRKDGHHGPVMSCEHCPLVWYHKLCHDLEFSSHDPFAQISAVWKRVEGLPEDERVVVETKLAGAAALEPTSPPELNTCREQLELLMMLLRAHCEAKQSTHVHDTPQPRHEFLTHYLGGGAIFMRAKRSLTNSFDQLLKRKGSRDDLSFRAPPPPPISHKDDSSNHESNTDNSDSEEKSGGPMKNIFLKVGQGSGGNEIESEDEEGGVSWRQAIFNTVMTPTKQQQSVRKDQEYYRSLWKKAINQQVLLIRMDKENARLTANQEEANVKRIKLEYDDLGCKESSPIWDMVISKDSAHPCDHKLLMEALKHGIPRSKRGEVWMSLTESFSIKSQPVDHNKFPNYNVPYEDLLKQLTSHQHAILIDLGRTLPNHKYFKRPLGPGQLSLFNLLKAYSLLDPEVGYCQGLSFIAAVLLLHMSEEEAYYLLREVMFGRGLRTRYLPGMSALQVHLYQLSRLLLDTRPNLHKHLDKYDVSPTLYAAPWLLTLFASQFPIGFVARVFDLILADSPEVLFKVGVALLGQHEEQLLKCHSFESIMDYLKKDLTAVDAETMDKIVAEVLSRNVDKELSEYGVEYHVLQEEMSSPRPEAKKLKLLEASNKALAQQLQIATSNINRLEASRSAHLAEINKLESQVKSLQAAVSLLGEFVSTITYGNSDIEKPEEIVKILKNLGVKENGRRVTCTSAPLRVIEDEPEPPRRERPDLTRRVSDLFRPRSQENRVGRMLSDKEKESLLSRVSGRNSQETVGVNGKPLLKSSQSSYELITDNGCSQPSTLPLDSNGVHISYEGPTKLRSIRPLRSRNTLDSIPILPNRPSAQIHLKIVEKDDEIANKLKATRDKVTNLFDSDLSLDKTIPLSPDRTSS